MNRLGLVLVLTLAPTPLLRAQNPSPQAPPSPHADQPQNMPDPMHAHMMEMHQKEMEAMKADVEKMKLSLATIKANIPQISDSAEKARWQSNVDLWEVMLAHMEKMLGHMDSMGLGMHYYGPTHDRNMGSGPPPPAEKKQE
jgi:hypothetical protein